MLETARRNAHAVDKRVDVRGLKTNHPAHLVGGQLSFVDKAVEGAQRDPEPLARFARPHPLNRFVHEPTLADLKLNE